MDQDLEDAIRFGRLLADRLAAANETVARTDSGGIAITNLVAAGILLGLSQVVDAVCDVATDELTRERALERGR